MCVCAHVFTCLQLASAAFMKLTTPSRRLRNNNVNNRQSHSKQTSGRRERRPATCWHRSALPQLAAASSPPASSPSESLIGAYPESSVSALSDSPPAEPLTAPGERERDLELPESNHHCTRAKVSTVQACRHLFHINCEGKLLTTSPLNSSQLTTLGSRKVTARSGACSSCWLLM